MKKSHEISKIAAWGGLFDLKPYLHTNHMGYLCLIALGLFISISCGNSQGILRSCHMAEDDGMVFHWPDVQVFGIPCDCTNSAQCTKVEMI